MSRDNTWTWVILGGAAAVGYYLYSRGLVPGVSTPQTPAPLSIYPEFAYTAATSMAATPKQKATTAVVPPTPQFASVQQAEQSALFTQCVGNICTPVLGDTQLGF